MRLIYTITADCNPPPNEDYIQLNGADLDAQLEDAVAMFLIDAGASFAIDLSVRREP